MQESRICLATVTTEDFLPGTVVTVGSFLKAHPDFDGDMVDRVGSICQRRHRRRP